LPASYERAGLVCAWLVRAGLVHAGLVRAGLVLWIWFVVI
jgi:hypothetical protein